MRTDVEKSTDTGMNDPVHPAIGSGLRELTDDVAFEEIRHMLGM